MNGYRIINNFLDMEFDMAGMDYISCKRCGTKVVYDGDWNGRDRLLDFWKTTELLCPDCIEKYEKVISKALDCLRRGKMSLAKKVLGGAL